MIDKNTVWSLLILVILLFSTIYFIMDVFPFKYDSKICKYRYKYIFIPRIYNDTHIKCQDYYIDNISIHSIQPSNITDTNK